MRSPREIHHLCQLTDKELFSKVADGLKLILENARTYISSANALAGGRAARHLYSVGEEEAAKVLILLDAIRCPRHLDPQGMFSRQLGYFNNHLARGIYAWYTITKPATFAEVQRIVEDARQNRYYDGDYGEYEYRNRILASREEDLYVDYVMDDGVRQWVSPAETDKVYSHAQLLPSTVIELADALIRVGCGSAAGLQIVADKWRAIAISDNLHWSDYVVHNIETVDLLRRPGLSEAAEENHRDTVVDGWGYPLYSLDLKK